MDWLHYFVSQNWCSCKAALKPKKWAEQFASTNVIRYFFHVIRRFMKNNRNLTMKIDQRNVMNEIINEMNAKKRGLFRKFSKWNSHLVSTQMLQFWIITNEWVLLFSECFSSLSSAYWISHHLCWLFWKYWIWILSKSVKHAQ